MPKRERSRAHQIALVISMVIIVAASASCSFSSKPPAPVCSGVNESVVASFVPFETLALLWIADEREFFARNCLDVTLRQYDTGSAALEGMVTGEAHIAVGTSEFPLVIKAFAGEKIKAIGSLDKIEFIHLVARKDSGVRKVSDLKGKRVGTTKGTIAEFYLGRFLELNGLKMQDVTVVDVKTPDAWVNAIVEGDIDAIATTQPHVSKIMERLGANAVQWPAQSNQPMHALILSSEEWLGKNPEVAGKFLKSLAQAEDYLISHPVQTRTIVQKQLDLEPGYAKTVWSQNQYSLSLDQSLVVAMEDEARWMIDNKLTTATQIPDFQSYIYPDALEKIRPEAVNVIH